VILELLFYFLKKGLPKDSYQKDMNPWLSLGYN